ncbi:MAG: 3,4-dihydroxy-2-butanone-4-phosphate synthase [Gammaproteobacteria bacterium]
MKFNSTEEIVEDIAAGKMVVIVDDEDRENEGDILMAASMVRPEDVNFMAKYGRGLICLTLTKERCQQLNLPLMVDVTEADHTTNFTISIEASEGVTTGISAYDRAHTIRTAVAPNANSNSITQPGHIFPLMAQAGGVLTRAGHTEAGCDYARLAQLEPAAVIVEIMDEDGTMARRPQLEKFAQEHDLKIGTIEDLIRYRIQHERTVHRMSSQPFSTDCGDFELVTYKDTINKEVHFALVKGEVDSKQPIVTRVHIENTLCDTLLGNSASCGWPLRDAMKKIASEDVGIAVILRIANDSESLCQQLENLNISKKERLDSDSTDSPVNRWTLGVGGQILSDLGVQKMRLLSAPQVFHGLGGFGLEIVEYIDGKQN